MGKNDAYSGVFFASFGDVFPALGCQQYLNTSRIAFSVLLTRYISETAQRRTQNRTSKEHARPRISVRASESIARTTKHAQNTFSIYTN